MTCNLCNNIPEYAEIRGVLIHTSGPTALPKLERLLTKERIDATQPLPDTHLIMRAPEDLLALLLSWQLQLNEVERADVRAAAIEADDPTPQTLTRALLNIGNLDALIARLESRWFIELLKAEDFRSHYQPLVNATDGRIAAYECLLRGRHDGSEVPPSEIFHMARMLGHSHLLDTIARRTSVRAARQAIERGADVFINFNPNSIYDPTHCLRDTVAACEEFGVPLERLVFEVVEAERIEDLAHLKHIIEVYRSRGARVALDDLGSGYSSILLLAQLVPDFVKLDHGLVCGAWQESGRRAILRAITSAAREMEISVVAEGIETVEDFEFCLDLGVDLLQGWFLARPAETPPDLTVEAAQAFASRTNTSS